MTSGIRENVFLEILDETKKRLLNPAKGLKTIKSGDEFEAILFNEIKEICAMRKIRDCRRTGKQTFPDIIIWPFGIEAKSTISDSWVSTGNSIVETTRVPDLKEIYMYFLKQNKNGTKNIRFKPYAECLSDIVVTHSPRYKIDMHLAKDENIFKKMTISYNAFRKGDAIRLAKEYYKSILKPGEELWWIDQPEESGVTPIIRNFSDLDSKTQQVFKIESMVYFPEIFSSSTHKYVKVTLHLLQKYQATCSSLRDLFTAGGRMTVTLQRGKKASIPKVFYNLYINATSINQSLNKMDRDELARIWNVKIGVSQKNETIWLRLLDKYSEINKPKASRIYKAGLCDL
jgi:hypothetical protein